MYQIRPGLVLGFHGCDIKTQQSVISGKTTLEASSNNWDWLGHGIYFWEYSLERAHDYAKVLKVIFFRLSKIKNLILFNF